MIQQVSTSLIDETTGQRVQVPVIVNTDLIRNQVSAEAYSRIINDQPLTQDEENIVNNAIIQSATPDLEIQPILQPSVAERIVTAQTSRVLTLDEQLTEQIAKRDEALSKIAQVQSNPMYSPEAKTEIISGYQYDIELYNRNILDLNNQINHSKELITQAEDRVVYEDQVQQVESLGSIPSNRMTTQVEAVAAELPDISKTEIMQIIGTTQPDVLVSSGLAEIDVTKLAEVFPENGYDILKDIQHAKPLDEETAQKLIDTGIVTEVGSTKLKAIREAEDKTVKKLGWLDRLVEYIYKSLYK